MDYITKRGGNLESTDPRELSRAFQSFPELSRAFQSFPEDSRIESPIGAGCASSWPGDPALEPDPPISTSDLVSPNLCIPEPQICEINVRSRIPKSVYS